MIKVNGLNKTFITKQRSQQSFSILRKRVIKQFVAVNNLDLEVNKGEFIAFLGPNGAGKTTTLKMLSGILYPTKGEIDIFGYKPFEKKKEFKKLISFVMAQKTQLFLELPIQDTFNFIAEIYEVDKTLYKKNLKELVDRFELTDKLNTIGRRLSLGQRMKAELICSIIYNPKVLFLDEPTIGLDVNSSREVRKFLKEINKIYNTTIILTTHNMDDVEELCDRTVVINKGEKMFDGKTKDLKGIFGDTREIEFIIDTSSPIKGTHTFSNKDVTIIESTDSLLKISCNKKDSSQIIQEIMGVYPIIEINFNETDLSEVIGKIYKQ